MAKGIFQLAAVGSEDKVLTENPQITFFKTVYRRHSNFTLFQHKLPFNGTLKFGTETICNIDKIGDLLHKLYIVIDLPRILLHSLPIMRESIKMLLNEYNITWTYDFNDDVSEDDLYVILELINDKITSLKDTILLHSTYVDNINSNNNLNPTNSHLTLELYINEFNTFLLPDDYKIIYDFINALSIDFVNTNENISNLDMIQKILYYTIRSFSDDNQDITKSIFVIKPDQNSYLESAYIFISNVEYGNYYNNVELLNSFKLFQDQLEYIYKNDENVSSNYTILDPYITLLKFFNLTSTNVIKDNTLLYNNKYYLIKNMILNLRLNLEVMYNIFSILTKNRYTFNVLKKYKFQTGTQPNDITARFINVSQQNIISFSRLDLFTNFILEESNLQGSIYRQVNDEGNYHYYGIYIQQMITAFNANIASLFNNEIYEDYFKNDITNVWSRLSLVSDVYNTYTNLNTLDSGLITIFGGALLFNFVPLLVLNDLNSELINYSNNIFPGDVAFVTSLTNEITQLATEITTNIKPSIMITAEDIMNLTTVIAGYRQNAKDKFLFSLLRPEMNMAQYVVGYDQEAIVTPMMYIKISYLKKINEILSGYLVGNSDATKITNTFNVVVNSFFTPSTNIPKYSHYQRFLRIYNGNNIDYFTQPINTICDVASSIWFNIQNDFIVLFNNLFNKNLLNLEYYSNNLGIDIYTDLKYIIDNFIDVKYVNESNFIDYYLMNSDIIFNENLVPYVSISNYINAENLYQLYYNNNYILTKNLLNIKFLQLNRNVMFFNKVGDIVNEFISKISGNPLYGYNSNTQVVLDLILTSVTTQILNSNIYNVGDVIDSISSLFESTINNSVNPFDVGTKLYDWYNIYNVNIISINPNSKTHYIDMMQTILGTLTPSYIYSDIFYKQNNPNYFTKKSDVYEYIKNYILKTNNIKKNIYDYTSIQNLYNSFILLHTTKINDSNNILNKIDNIDQNNKPLKYPKLYTKIKNMVNGTVFPFSWINYLGYFCIEYVSLIINQQEVDRQTGAWLYIYNSLFEKHDHKRGNDIMIGNTKSLTSYNKEEKPSYRLYVALQHWFCRYIETSLPIISLHNSNIYIRIKLKNIHELYFSTMKIQKNINISGFILGEFIYVDNKERHIIAKSKHEYLIEYIINESFIYDYTRLTNPTSGTIEIKLKSIEMCKEIIWTIQTGKNIKNKQWNIFTYKNKNPCVSAKIIFNGNERETFHDIQVYELIMPYQCHTTSPNIGINVYSFALYPEFLQPSGCANLSLLDVRLIITLHPELLVDMKNNKEYININIYISAQNILRIMSGLSGIAFFK